MRGAGCRRGEKRLRTVRTPALSRRIPSTVAVALTALLPVVAGAQDRRGIKDMRTAEQYAALAAGARNLEDARTNLQQALNCLEGPQGAEYRRSAGDPCGGAGLAHELPEGSVNRIRVEKATRLAGVGVTFHDFDPAHFTALAVRAVLAEGTR